MKKKIFSLVMGIFLLFGGLFAFSGCSLVSKDSNKINNNIVMKIGNTNVTKNDLYNAFYTYYQNNSSYFSYYDQDTIEESFYTWFTVKTMVNELSYEALKNGTIYYTNEDAKTVWKYVEEYFYNQISSYEKSIYTLRGVKEDNYPSWLKSESSDSSETPKSFEFYSSPISEVMSKLTDRSADATKKLTKDEVFAKIDDLKSSLYKYDSTNDNGEEIKKDMMDDPYKVRNEAYSNYIMALISNAKASGNDIDKNEAFKQEVWRIYEAYYDSQISVIFQNYYVQEQLLDYNGQGDKVTLSDGAVVASFLGKYYTDMQKNQVQKDYVSTMESSDGASLVLYHYNGKHYYFSVQHILVKFNDALIKKLSKIDGYNVTKANHLIAESYKRARNELASSNIESILTEINKDNEKSSILTIGNYYYYDEAEKDFYGTKNDNAGVAFEIYNGYVKLSEQDVEGNYVYKTYTKADGAEITYKSEGVKKMATVADVKKAFELNNSKWLEIARPYFNGTNTESIEDFCAKDDKKYESIKYVLEMAAELKENGVTDENVLKNKISSAIFIELEWIYSGDSLDNKIGNKIGYIVSSEPDNNMSWVVDFAVGARNMIESYKAKTADEKVTYTESVITDYGYHIMKIENVYDDDNISIIDLDSITDDFSLENNSAYVNAVTKLLKTTFICGSSNETLYNYYKDELYNTCVGSSKSAGSYFLDLEYQWLNKYYNDKKVETIKKIGYDELVSTIS